MKAFLSQYFPISFFHRPKLGFSIHSDSLSDIARLGEKALDRAEKEKFIKFKKGERFGEHLRDMIYLGSSYYSYETWRDSVSTQAHPSI